MKTFCNSLCVLLSLIYSISTFTQVEHESYGDEWIVEGQEYFRIIVDRDGVYQLTYNDLIEAGMPLDRVRGRQLELFNNGQRIPLFVSNEGLQKEGDFIEFYGQSNDGTIDALLYEDASLQQLNPYVSLYGENRTYYLTWSEEEGGIFYTVHTNGLESQGRPPQEPYYMHREILRFDEFHHKPSHDGRNFIRYSSMDYAEGYGSDLQKERTLTFPIQHLSGFGVDPKIVLRLGSNIHSRNWKISTGDRQLAVVPRIGYGISEIDERFPLEDLYEGDFPVSVEPLSAQNARHTIAQIEIHYPREYVYDGEIEISFHQQASILSRYIEIKGFGGQSPKLYNLTGHFFLIPEQEADILKFITPAAFKEHSWILVDAESGVRRPQEISRVNQTNISQSGEYLIITTNELYSSEAVQSYASYRSSPDGGNYDVSVINYSDLVDRFAYGIDGHPIAIKNYLRKLYEEDQLPEFVFLIGKAREYTDIREGLVDHAVLPTFGIPGSDNLLVAFDNKRHPKTAIGRLAAQSESEVENYLQKIIQHEHPIEQSQTLADQGWKKNVIHLSGGSAGNQATIFRFLNEMGEVISYNTFGADIFTFRKTSSDPLQRVTAEDIMQQINHGASWLTFFGHSAVGTFDFSLEDPSKYSNERRNPIILSLGCHSGNIHTANKGISEDFVLEPGKGAIAFIASSGTAYPEPQFDTGRKLYELLGGDLYGEPIGQILQKSLEYRTNNPSLAVQTLIEQLTLHGDPAYRVGGFQGPDYIVDESSVSIDPGIVNATSSFVSLSFDILNLGAVRDEELLVRLHHVLPDGSFADTIEVFLQAPAYRSEISVELNNPGSEWIGANRILIEVNADNSIAEYPNAKAENNNDLIGEDGEKGISFFVFDNSAKPVFPPDFGIQSEAPFVLRAALNNGLRPGGIFQLQIDTTEHFDSPLFVSEVIENESSVLEWTPDIPALPEVVYYWRVAPVEENGQLKSSIWSHSSFVYLPQSPPGWNQSHHFQFQKNRFYKKQLDNDLRRFSYDQREWDVRIKNEIRSDGDFWVYVNNTPWASLNPRNMGSYLSIFAWDRQDVIIRNNGSDFGSDPFSSDSFIYDMDDVQDISNIIDLLSAFPDGARVFVHTILESEDADLLIDKWDDPLGDQGESLIEVLQRNGARRVHEILERGTVPYTLIYDKGGASVVEDIANNILETIDLSSKAFSIWPEGWMGSVTIPEAGRWLRLLWEEEKEESDFTELLVLGRRPGGQIDTLKKIKNDYSVNLTSINPGRYPTIDLVYYTSDEQNKSAPQIKYWRILETTLPDAAFYTKTSSFQLRDTLNAGEALEVNYQLLNLTEVDMGPVLVKYTLIDEEYGEQIVIKRTSALPAKDTIQVNELISIDQLSGNYQLVVEINPRQDQKEISDCNNLGFAQFYVRPDTRNPYLDVTFDGKHIRDGERISEYPEIVVSLRDDNPFVLLDNPDDFDITLYSPELFSWKIVPGSPVVDWRPATSLEENIARFVITPHLNQEGIYTLKVQAKDIAGNPAGDQTFRITFQIDLDDDYPKLTVHPNPMTSYADFEYYLDSDIAPDIFNLYIYSADGKLIKHVRKSDFGQLRRGVNRYRWYGQTDSGELLTTGLYFYEFVNSVDGRKTKPKGSIFMVR